ncbi:MAG: glycosyltransferase [Gammaproteobacteria bacterium]|nr:glycosyltransferase [Gammaproteobacteria bacterium]
MIDSDSKTTASMLVIVLSEPGERIPPEWLERVQRRLPGDYLATEDGHAPDGLPAIPGSRGPWWQWLGEVDTRRATGGIVLLAAGVEVPDDAGVRFRHALLAPSCPPLLALPGNHEAALNPFAGLAVEEDPDLLDSFVRAASDLRWTPVRHAPRRFAIIPPGGVDEACRQATESRCHHYDGIWVHDPERATNAGEGPAPDIRAAGGHLRLAVEELQQSGFREALPPFGFDHRPVLLHVSHDWGGGVARWIADITSADTSHHHLVLSAGGRTDGRVHGQFLKLYAAGPGRGAIRRWTLAPAIAGTAPEHPQYRQVLEQVIARYGIDRVVVSSLVGHSLDALSTGLPTLQVLHDFYPAWPALDRDPFDYRGGETGIDLERAIADDADGFLFEERDASHWRHLTERWLERVASSNVSLLAPTRQVHERWQQLTGDALERVQVLPHGFAGWPAGHAAVRPRALPDSRLNLVVVGRLSPGKGLGLLERALPDVRRHARITLLGCGHHGMRFFGQPGVDIVLDYAHDQLPRHLARTGAQAVLFLSTVAETWNYVLTETRALGLVPLATRTGSFVERIRDGRDGLLFDPRPEALADAVARLAAEPERLESMRARLPDEPGFDPQLGVIDGLAPDREPSLPAPGPSDPGQARSSAVSAELADRHLRLGELEVERDRLQQDLAERTEWARKYERLSRERTAWARQLDTDLERTRREYEAELEERTRWARSLERDVELARGRADHLESELETIFASRSWRLTRPMRVANRIAANAIRRRVYNPARWPRLLARLAHNLRNHGLRGTLELMQQRQAAPPRPPATVAPVEAPSDEPPRPVAFPPQDRPRASIIVPVYNKLAYTAACLNSIAEHTAATAFEVIVVDDCSSDGTAEYLSECRGLRALGNTENSGFIASCNRGARAARGEFLVFLNNDTTVTPGWLDALVDTFERFPEAGIAGARLVYPDGRLQEAGGIVFSDGSGWNYGRGDEPDRPEYGFACEADYVSGACLAIRKRDFERLEGFDRHYAPAYYEDTDLCFRIRESGGKVIYQPACTIVHHEGVSSGTDESSGAKRYQAVNHEKFLERWKATLGRQPPPVPGPEAVRAVARARHHRCRGRVLVIDAVTPEPDKDSGSMRMVALLEILLDHGYRVSFMPENLAWTQGYTRDLQALGVEVLYHPWVSGCEDWLRQNGRDLDLVIASRHYVLGPILPTLRTLCPEARVVFDTVDLHFLREARMAGLTGDSRAERMAERTRPDPGLRRHAGRESDGSGTARRNGARCRHSRPVEYPPDPRSRTGLAGAPRPALRGRLPASAQRRCGRMADRRHHAARAATAARRAPAPDRQPHARDAAGAPRRGRGSARLRRGPLSLSQRLPTFAGPAALRGGGQGQGQPGDGLGPAGGRQQLRGRGHVPERRRRRPDRRRCRPVRRSRDPGLP